MSRWKWTGLVFILVALGFGVSAQQLQQGPPNLFANHPLAPGDKGGTNETGPYEVIPDHFKPRFPAGMTWGVVAGIYAESPDRVFVYQRGILPELKEPISVTGIPVRDNLIQNANSANSPLGKTMRREYVLTVYDRNGNMIDHWKHLDPMHPQGSLAHTIMQNPYDPEKHLWLIDEGLNGGQILKVTRDGKVVMNVGGSKDNENGCYRPQDIAFLPNGDFWCLEGFDTPRVVKISKDGKRLPEAFGKQGTGPGEFLAPHGLALDSRGRIYVAEQNGHRIQVFDSTGKSIDIWPNIRRSQAVFVDGKEVVWHIGVGTIAGYDTNGRLIYSWGELGANPGQLYGLSQIDVDREGNLYVAELRTGRVQKFRPKKGADPKQLIAWPLDQRR